MINNFKKPDLNAPRYREKRLGLLNEETIMHWRNNINLHYNIPNIRQKTVFVK